MNLLCNLFKYGKIVSFVVTFSSCYINSGELSSRSDGATPISNR
ncbi:hypothetical protein [Candidatus Tisiphia endosymbiont of Ceraclea dissimilis]